MSNVDSQTVNITIPKALLKQVDALAKRDYTSRSDIIRQALLTKIRSPQSVTDEWGDAGKWETIVDFRDVEHPDGIPASEVIVALQQLEAHDRQNHKATRKADV